MNFLPVLVATIIGMAIGALWYSPYVFGREWIKLSRYSKEDLQAAQSRGMWSQYVAQFIAMLVMFAILGFLISAGNLRSGTDGAFLALIIWLGFIAANSIGDYLWANRSIKLILINTVGTLIPLIIGGAIMGAWQ